MASIMTQTKQLGMAKEIIFCDINHFYHLHYHLSLHLFDETERELIILCPWIELREHQEEMLKMYCQQNGKNLTVYTHKPTDEKGGQTIEKLQELGAKVFFDEKFDFSVGWLTEFIPFMKEHFSSKEKHLPLYWLGYLDRYGLIAKMIQLHESKPVPLPSDFFEKAFPMKKEEDVYESAVMILTPSTKIIKIFPTKGHKAIKIVIEVEDMDDFVTEFRNKMRVLFGTPQEITQDSVTWKLFIQTFNHWTCDGYNICEFYLDPSALKISQEQLEEELSEIKGVNKVEMILIV